MEIVHMSVCKMWIKKLWAAAISEENKFSVIWNETVKNGFCKIIKLIFCCVEQNGQKWFLQNN